MELPDSATLVLEARRYSELSLTELIEQAHPAHTELFPSDRLLGDSQESQYREWIRRQLKPKLDAMGSEGKRWWKIMTSVDLFDHPEALTETLLVLSMWFLPGEEKYFATLALLVLVRRLGGPKHGT